MKKYLMAAGLVAASATAGLVGITAASAETVPASTLAPASSLVQAIATRFNLRAADVQSVVDSQRTQMQQQHQQAVDAEIAQLVKDGKLTQAQADKIIAKRTELQANRDSNRAAMQSKTVAERQAAREARENELGTWLKDNGISADFEYLLMGGHGYGHGRGVPGGAQ